MDMLEWLKLTPDISDIDDWARIWSVHDDPFPHIRCKRCDGYQKLENSAAPFVHSPACGLMGSQSRLPWRDLMWIVGNVKKD